MKNWISAKLAGNRLSAAAGIAPVFPTLVLSGAVNIRVWLIFAFLFLNTLGNLV